MRNFGIGRDPEMEQQETQVVERFIAAGIPAGAIRCTPDTYKFRSEGSPSEFFTRFRHLYGPTMNAFEAAEKDGTVDALYAELNALFNAQNQSENAGTTIMPATYLRVEVSVPT